MRPSSSTTSVRHRISPPLAVFAVIFAAVWCAAILVLAVDPLGVWGTAGKLDHSDFAKGAAPDLVAAVAEDPTIDVVLVGASTAMRFSRASLNQNLRAFNAVNLSYPGARPADRAVVMSRLLRANHFRRIVVMLDWTYIMPATSMRAGFPNYLYDDGVLDKLRMVGVSTVFYALQRLAGQPLRLPAWHSAGTGGEDEDEQMGANNIQTPAALRRIADAIKARRHDIDSPARMTCGDITALRSQLVPETKAASAQHIRLDVVIPPLSLATYYMKVNDYRFLNRQLLLRRCAVEALDGLPGVAIFAFDNVDWLTGDLANYQNPGHIQSAAALSFMLQSIAEGSHRLTKANLSAEMALLHDRILHYEIRDSAVPGFSRHGS